MVLSLSAAAVAMAQEITVLHRASSQVTRSRLLLAVEQLVELSLWQRATLVMYRSKASAMRTCRRDMVAEKHLYVAEAAALAQVVVACQ